MKVTFYSTFLTMHQVPFCNAMYRILGDDFRYVACEATYTERLRLGYPDLNKQYPYVLRSYESEAQQKLAMELSMSSDVVVIGSASERYCRSRLLKKNKLTFKYAERPLKPSVNTKSLKFLINMVYRHVSYRHKNCYLLAAGAYSASDFAKYGCYKGKAFKWGYFTEPLENRERNNEVVKILWAGRMIDWKHPEFCTFLQRQLKKEDLHAEITMAGIGPLLEQLEKNAEGIRFTGAVEQENMRKLYESHDVFLMTSDEEEGWGAVVNEAMSAGCAVVADFAAGSVPWLIQDGQNGLTYSDHDLDQFCAQVISLLKDPSMIRQLGDRATDTIRDLWNAEVAADRFLKTAEDLLAGYVHFFEEGPMSRA